MSSQVTKPHTLSLAVIIPVYNGASYIEECLQSVCAQTVCPDEIIVIDDGSTDESQAIAQRYATRVMKQNHAGAAAARNCGIQGATSDYIAFLDADDVYEPHALETLYQSLMNEPSAYAAFSQGIDFVSAELTAEEKETLMPRTDAYRGIFTGMTLFKRAVFSRIGLLDETLVTGECADWLVRFKDADLAYCVVNEVTVRRRLHTANSQIGKRMQERKDYLTLLRKRHRL